MEKFVLLTYAVLLLAENAFSAPSDDELIANVFQTGAGGFNPEKGGCKCIPFFQCQNGTQTRDGAGLINYRLLPYKCSCECLTITESCCYVPPEKKPKDVTTTNPIDSPTSTAKPKVTTTRHSPTSTAKPKVTTNRPPRKPKCGMRRVDLLETKIMGAKNKTKSSEFPWMVAIFHSEENNGHEVKRYMCAGSLIHERVVMTVAHCAKQLVEENTVLRAGAWDLNNNEESEDHQDRYVSQIIVHRSFSSRYVKNDVALLVTTTPFKFAINVDVLCLTKIDDVVSDDSCIAAGWGKNETGEATESMNETPQSIPQMTSRVRPYVLDFDFGGGATYHFERGPGGIRDVFRLKINPIESPLWSAREIVVESIRGNPTPKPHSQPRPQPNPTGQYNASAFQYGLKYVELPTVPRAECESKLQETRLGSYFTLHESHMCAGGVPGKDTCKGDGGSPLICPIKGQTNRYQQVGIVAAGIGCGTDVPGIYADVAFLRPWIDQQVTQLGFIPAYNY